MAALDLAFELGHVIIIVEPSLAPCRLEIWRSFLRGTGFTQVLAGRQLMRWHRPIKEKRAGKGK
jgi:hypothetical protein